MKQSHRRDRGYYTEQCNVWSQSARRGYLYANTYIFESLRVVSYGIQIIACLLLVRAKILGNMGFEPQGDFFDYGRG